MGHLTGAGWNAEDLLGALARCHGTQENPGEMGKLGFSHPELQQSTVQGTKIPCFPRDSAVVASHHSHLLPSTCTPIPLVEMLPLSELILEFWGFNTTFGSSQELPTSGTSPQWHRRQGGADPKSSREVKERGEGEEKPRFQKSILFSFLGILLKHSEVFPSLPQHNPGIHFPSQLPPIQTSSIRRQQP